MGKKQQAMQLIAGAITRLDAVSALLDAAYVKHKEAAKSGNT